MRAVLLAIFALQAVAGHEVGRDSSGATERAAAWLRRMHGDPDMGDLNGFAASDPDGYALVKALLLKRNLGLLDPRKPTASFAAPATHKSDDDEPSGAAAFAKFASPGELKKHASTESVASYQEVAAPYPEAQSSSAKSFAYKPPSSDDDLVASVLGEVSQMTGASPKKSLISQNRDAGVVSSFAADEMAMGVAGANAATIPSFVAPTAAAADSQPAAQVAQVAHEESPPAPKGPFGMPAISWGVPKAPGLDTPLAAVAQIPVQAAIAPIAAAPVAPVRHASAPVDNPYLSGIDFGAKAKHDTPVPVQSAVQPLQATADNPYLQGLDFGIKAAVPKVPAATVEQPTQRAAATPDAAVTALDFNSEIAKMSASSQPAAAPTAKAQSQPAVEAQNIPKKRSGGNPYLADIGFASMGPAAERASSSMTPRAMREPAAPAVPVAFGQPVKPAAAQVDAPATLDFNAEVDKLSTPFQSFAKFDAPTSKPKPKAALATQEQKVQKPKSEGNQYLKSIGFSNMLNGNIGGDDDLRLFRFGDETPAESQPLTMAMQTGVTFDKKAAPSLRHQASLSEQAATVSKTDSESTADDDAIGKWLGKKDPEAAEVHTQTPTPSNGFMADLE